MLTIYFEDNILSIILYIACKFIAVYMVGHACCCMDGYSRICVLILKFQAQWFLNVVVGFKKLQVDL